MLRRRATALERLAEAAPHLADGISIAAEIGGAAARRQAKTVFNQGQQGSPAERCAFEHVRTAERGLRIIAGGNERAARQRGKFGRIGPESKDIALEERGFAARRVVAEPAAEHPGGEPGLERHMESPHALDVPPITADDASRALKSIRLSSR